MLLLNSVVSNFQDCQGRGSQGSGAKALATPPLLDQSVQLPLILTTSIREKSNNSEAYTNKPQKTKNQKKKRKTLKTTKLPPRQNKRYTR